MCYSTSSNGTVGHSDAHNAVDGLEVKPGLTDNESFATDSFL